MYLLNGPQSIYHSNVWRVRLGECCLAWLVLGKSLARNWARALHFRKGYLQHRSLNKYNTLVIGYYLFFHGQSVGVFMNLNCSFLSAEN